MSSLRDFELLVARFIKIGMTDSDARRNAAHQIAGGVARKTDPDYLLSKSVDAERLREGYYTRDVNVTHDYRGKWI